MPPLEDQLSEAPSPACPVGGGVAALLCRGAETWPTADPRVELVRQLAIALARGAGALDLRLARLCCFVQEQDLRPLGYGSFGSFVREALDWQPSRQRELARLLRSDLELVKRAVGRGLVPVTVAARAPGRVAPDQQADWLLRVAEDDPDADEPLGLEIVGGEEARTAQRARGLVRLLVGASLPDRECDRTLLDWWAQGRVGAELLAQAYAPRPAPALGPATWPDDDLATPLVGPWEQPRDLEHALRLIEQVQAARRQRRVLLGRLLDRVQQAWLFLDWGHDRFDDWVRAELDLSVRSGQRLRALGRTLDLHPELAVAVPEPLSPRRAVLVGRLVETGRQARQWLALAQRVPLAELQEAARMQDASQRARDLQALVADAPGLVTRAMADGGVTTETGAARLGTSDPARIRVALAPGDPERGAEHGARLLRVPQGLVEAARWLLDTVCVPPQRGAGRVKERQHFVCQNPECRRRALRNHAHHIVERAHGGDNDDRNLVCLCPSCHLRLRHGGFMDVVRVDDALVFLYPGRAVVLR